ncbi:MAG: amidohydrolase family protein [Planctomycetota bacterium]
MAEAPDDATPRRLRAAAVCGFDTDAAEHRPGAVVTRRGRVIDAGPAEEMWRRYGDVPERDLGPRLLVPGFVNAHTHLELTAIGPRPYGGDFVGWVEMLRSYWPGDGVAFAKRPDPGWFATAAADGARQAIAAGTDAVGDISRFDGVAGARRGVGLAGVSFVEVFGLGPPWDADALARLSQPADGFQPHAPYSAGPALFDAACNTGKPLSCHLAETPEEARFVAAAQGPFRDLLERLGKWSDGFAAAYGDGLSPVRWMEPYLRRRPWLLAHGNYVDDDDLALLAETGASVAYCPVASEYFGHPRKGHPPHRYREMLAAGVNVCLGTDSVVCQPEEEPQPLGVLPQMRRLHRRDGTDPALLLRMATTHGRQALGLGDAVTRLAALRFDPDDPTPALTQVLRRDDPAEGYAAATAG